VSIECFSRIASLSSITLLTIISSYPNFLSNSLTSLSRNSIFATAGIFSNAFPILCTRLSISLISLLIELSESSISLSLS